MMGVLTAKALGIFVLTYFFISFPKVRWFHLDRPSGALLGAVLMVLLGVVTLEEAYRLIDFNTITLLLGMMILIAYFEIAHFFDWLSGHLMGHAHKPLSLFWALVFISGFLSAIFVNDTVCLMLTPLLVKTLKRARLNPVPFLLALCTSSNVGSVMTLTGNPQNMIIGIHSDWSYHSFFFLMLPIALIGLVLNGLVIYMFYKKELRERRTPMTFHFSFLELDKWLTVKASAVLLMVLILFVTTRNLPLAAIMGGSLMLLVGGRKPAEAFQNVDWTLLLFFAGLFIVVGGMAKTGLPQFFYEKLEPFLKGVFLGQMGFFSVFSLLGSNLVSNVPFVLLAVQWVPRFEQSHWMWLVLAMSSTFAGNLTIVGSVANMIVLEASKDEVFVGFWEFFRVGILTTILSIAVGVSFIGFYSLFLRS